MWTFYVLWINLFVLSLKCNCYLFLEKSKFYISTKYYTAQCDYTEHREKEDGIKMIKNCIFNNYFSWCSYFLTLVGIQLSHSTVQLLNYLIYFIKIFLVAFLRCENLYINYKKKIKSFLSYPKSKNKTSHRRGFYYLLLISVQSRGL